MATLYLGRSSGTTSSSSHSCDLCDVEPDVESSFFPDKKDETEESVHLLGACVYIAGYLCHQFPDLEKLNREDDDLCKSEAFEFIHVLDRGGLKSRPKSCFVCSQLPL